MSRFFLNLYNHLNLWQKKIRDNWCNSWQKNLKPETKQT
ncbi:hypothetical protein RC62_4548 [Flavobacterium aquidurense]|uniref:Uncharacterized protein n=1 Tax=Flavobacterium aquidurense TaxID=362413 RepID=A0A0N8VN54_9FLAO|nr:hypothetical protein RC62_4548 [Flavobacterium aquidurense]